MVMLGRLLERLGVAPGEVAEVRVKCPRTNHVAKACSVCGRRIGGDDALVTVRTRDLRVHHVCRQCVEEASREGKR